MIRFLILLFFDLFDQIAFRDYIFFDLAFKSYFTNIHNHYQPDTIIRVWIMIFLYWAFRNINPQYSYDAHHRYIYGLVPDRARQTRRRRHQDTVITSSYRIL